VDARAPATNHHFGLDHRQYVGRPRRLQTWRLRPFAVSAGAARQRDPSLLRRHSARLRVRDPSGVAAGGWWLRREHGPEHVVAVRLQRELLLPPAVSLDLPDRGRWPGHRHALDVHLRARHRLREVREAARYSREQDPALHVQERDVAPAHGPRAGARCDGGRRIDHRDDLQLPRARDGRFDGNSG
jgi:hypothetical protein